MKCNEIYLLTKTNCLQERRNKDIKDRTQTQNESERLKEIQMEEQDPELAPKNPTQKNQNK